jgi:hypothetical protein
MLRPAIIFSLIVYFFIIIFFSAADFPLMPFAADKTKVAGVKIADSCSVAPVNSPTLIKTFRLLDLNDGFGVSVLKDGGYLLTGDTLPASGMGAPKPFVIKTDAKGNALWSNWFGSQSLALGSMSSRRRGRLTIETTDGNIVLANDILDFVDENTKELYGDILVAKLNPKGKLLWSILLGDYSLDRPQKLWALPNGGVLVLGRFFKTGFGDDVADTDTVSRYSVLIKIDKNGRVQLAKKLDWEAEDLEYLTDGGFIALANINVKKTESAENILGSELVPHALPAIIKLDKNFNTVWAKSMEMIPSEISAPTSYADGALTIEKTVIRMPGGDFRAIKPAPDGGFIAFGFGDLTLSSGLITGLPSPITSFTPRALIAVKTDAAGNYQWAKKLTANLTFGIASNDFLVTKTIDGQFIIMQDTVRDSAAVQAPDFKLQPEALANNIALIKTDADFNPRWVKKIDAERDLSGYGLAPTTDKGVVIAANLLTTEQHLVMGVLEPYKEAALIKVDANGGVSGYVKVTEYPEATVADQSQYLIMQDMSVGKTANLKLNINKKVKAKLSVIKNKTRDICQYQKTAVAPVCSLLAPNGATGQSGAAPVAKTWALINYDNTVEVAADGEKNKAVHAELLPILNQIFDNQVKLKDNMQSMWLTYVFSRPATRADVEMAQKKYEELGYKIDSSDGGNLYVSKIGLALHLTFSITNSMAGKVEVMF